MPKVSEGEKADISGDKPVVNGAYRLNVFTGKPSVVRVFTSRKMKVSDGFGSHKDTYAMRGNVITGSVNCVELS